MGALRAPGPFRLRRDSEGRAQGSLRRGALSKPAGAGILLEASEALPDDEDSHRNLGG